MKRKHVSHYFAGIIKTIGDRLWMHNITVCNC
ncbi:hypothetical protein BDD39_000004 [Saccharococcus thermophilus]|uniref:Uncharacterized protein n=1 Tax=Saccharococcus thermophilus TaxID=29396 RepID=A0A846MHA3_9BACL|nr:hypothetical protein [Saccharococcus thermophilus]